MAWEGSARRTRLRLQVGMAGAGAVGGEDGGAEEERDRRLCVAEGEVSLDPSLGPRQQHTRPRTNIRIFAQATSRPSRAPSTPGNTPRAGGALPYFSAICAAHPCPAVRHRSESVQQGENQCLCRPAPARGHRH